MIREPPFFMSFLNLFLSAAILRATMGPIGIRKLHRQFISHRTWRGLDRWRTTPSSTHAHTNCRDHK